MSLFIQKLVKEYQNKNDIKSVDVDYNSLFIMHYERCLNRILRLFKWEGLPFPSHELETRAILSGYAGVVNDRKVKMMTAWGGMSGPTQYCDYFKEFTYAAPTAAGGSRKIGKNCAILRNTPNCTGLDMWLRRYADIYSHNDLSLRAALVNTRYQNVLKTTDSAKSETLQEWYKKMYNGELLALVDDSPLSEFVKGGGSIETLELNKHPDIDFTRYSELENELTRTFYRDIGIRWNKDKKANLVMGEVEQDNMLLEFNTLDMLESRKEFADEYNRVFKEQNPISVTLALQLESEVENVSYDNDREISGNESAD